MENPRYIDKDEIQQFEKFNQTFQVNNLEAQIIELKAKVLTTEIALKEEQKRLREYELRDIRSTMDDQKKSREEFTLKLKEKYGITSQSWGFRPENGEIKEVPDSK